MKMEATVPVRSPFAWSSDDCPPVLMRICNSYGQSASGITLLYDP
jgi:hypothetical protein